MPEITKVSGELIQMNAHYVDSPLTSFLFCLFIFLFVAAGCAFARALFIICEKGKRTPVLTIAIVLLILSGVSLIVGMNQPKDHVIMVCANGPVSIEAISEKYDILKIDGKMLKLRIKE